MRGRRVSDETVMLVRELRRRGFSLRGIARRARISKTSVYRLTKGISWERPPVQPICIETEKIATGERTQQGVHLIAAPEPQARQAKTDDEEKSELDQFRTYLIRNRIMCPPPPRPQHAGQQQIVCLTLQDSEESELDEAEAYVRRMPIASKFYDHVDFLSLLQAMESKDPLREYRELRKETLSPAVMMLRINKLLRSRRLS
jgi:hypothetical protein